MKYFLFILLIITSCKQEEKVVLQESFVYSISSESYVGFYKFLKKNDTVFNKTIYPDYPGLKYYILKRHERKRINDYLSVIETKQMDSEYVDFSVKDGFEYQFEFDQNRIIYVYEREDIELKFLNDFSNFLNDLNWSKDIKYFSNENVSKRTNIDFGNVDRFIIPDIPYDTIH